MEHLTIDNVPGKRMKVEPVVDPIKATSLWMEFNMTLKSALYGDTTQQWLFAYMHQCNYFLSFF